MHILARLLRSILWTIALWLGLVNVANAETLTLQLPISRASHGFTLWEWVSDTPDEGLVEFSQEIQGFGIQPGWYRTAPVIKMSLTGGTFGANGEWIPGSAPALTAFADKMSAQAPYFVMDDAAGQVGPGGHSLLTGTPWLSIESDPIFFFSLPVARKDHLLAVSAWGWDASLNQSWFGWFPLTVSPIQWLNVDGTFYSLGYLEGWTFLGPEVVSFTLYDLTTSESAPSDQTQLADPSFVWTQQSPFWPLSPVRIWVSDSSGTFELISPDGALQVLTPGEQNTNGDGYAVDGFVGFSKEFWLVRQSDGRSSQHWFVPWGGPINGIHEFDAISTFSQGPPPQDWQTLSFRASPGRNPGGWKIRRGADSIETPIEWDNSAVGTFVYDQSGTQSQWVEWYNGTAYVDTHGGWTVVSGSTDLGQGPDFIDWPVFFGATAQVAVPRSRFGHILSMSDGSNESPLTFVTPYGPATYPNAYVYSENYSVDLDNYTFSNPGGLNSTLHVVDGTTGESSPAFAFSPNVNFSVGDWHPTSGLFVKISATRWSHAMEIRCANGDVFPITKHRVEGDWSFDTGTGQSWFNSYGFFCASASRRTNIPWYLFDATTQEYLEPDVTGGGTSFINATDDTDTDGDGLADWYEHLIGTDPNDADTDNDGVSDGDEVANNTNPRAASAASDPNATLKVFTPLE